MSTAIELFESVVRERRWIQGKWSEQGADGRQYVCLTAAWGEPGTINSLGDCPANLFPRWVFELMRVLDDGVCAEDAPWLFQGFADRARSMQQLTPTQWHRIDDGFWIVCVETALGFARKHSEHVDAGIRQQVEAACTGVLEALRNRDHQERAEAVAFAAEAAAWTPAGAWAARDMAAREMAYKDMAQSLFALIDQELTEGTGVGGKP